MKPKQNLGLSIIVFLLVLSTGIATTGTLFTQRLETNNLTINETSITLISTEFQGISNFTTPKEKSLKTYVDNTLSSLYEE